MERIIGLLFTGAAIRIAGAALAIAIGVESADTFTQAVDAINNTLDSLPKNNVD